MSKIKETPAAVPEEADEHTGRGGSYVIENGKRVLVERTQSREEAQKVEQEVSDVATGT